MTATRRPRSAQERRLWCAHVVAVGGERVGSVSGRTYEVCNPATGEKVDSVPLGTAQDVNQAVQAAAQAFTTWAETSGEDRGVALANACELIKEHAAEIAQLEGARQALMNGDTSAVKSKARRARKPARRRTVRRADAVVRPSRPPCYA